MSAALCHFPNNPIMKIIPKQFRVHEGHAVHLKEWPTKVKSFYKSGNHYEQILAEHIKELSALQGLLYADNRHSLLLIFQAMDAAGKDGAIKHVMSGVNPQGCQVFSFKHPSLEEREHDFLWRTTRCLPERGHIGIFNRSYYEEVLIVRVHPEILRAEALPKESFTDKKIWEQRYRSITDFEKHLQRNGTRVLKFFLHLSKEEQRRRFLKRIENPDKNWKFSADDIKERKRWKDYMTAYEDCLSATSTSDSPWFVVPADDKKNARIIISRIIVEVLKEMNLAYPQADRQWRKELLEMKKSLVK
jgi:PPK2 family polyphosphate:nucleotide phosphotransferase